jgi:hypothetical protein
MTILKVKSALIEENETSLEKSFSKVITLLMKVINLNEK